MPRAYGTSCSAFSFNSVAPDDISVELLIRLPLVIVGIEGIRSILYRKVISGG